MTNKFILAITGPAGAGKSTISSMLAKQITNSVNIDADYVKHFIVNGFVYGDEPEGVKQWELLGKNLGLMAKNFHYEGYNVIINGYINEPAWKTMSKYVQLSHKILLLPHINAVVTRDSSRPEDRVMGQETVKRHHDYFSNSAFYDDFTKIDSTEHDIDETLVIIKKQLGLP